MFEYYVIADVYRVQIKTNCSKIEEYIKEYLGDFKRLTISFSFADIDTKKNDAVLTYMDCKDYNFSFDASNSSISFSIPWNEIDKCTLLPMIFRLIVELIRQKNGEIKMHASSIVKNGVAALFIAPSEGGKTSTAMSMCQKYGCELIGNDATVVAYKDGVPFVLRGDAVFKVRANGLKAYSDELYSSSSIGKKSDTPWYDKMLISTNEIGIKVFDRSTVLKYIFFVKLDSLVERCSILKYEKCDNKDKWFKPRMMVLQNISGTLRGADLIPAGNNGDILPLHIPSVDNEELSLYRVNFLNSLFNDCTLYQLRGGLCEITEFIKSTLNGE